jgi:drug/metabolite transporter (DMT)-like permease
MMVVAMAGFSLEDVLFKQLVTQLPIGQVLMLVGTGGGVIFTLLTWWGGRSVLTRDLLSPPILVRNVTEAVGSVVFVTALALSTLSGVSAILQATPLVVTLGAALFLGEKVGWRRWTAIGIGFAGVLLIVRPGTAQFDPASLFAVATVILLGVRDLSSRRVPSGIGSTQITAWGFFSVVPAGLFMLLVTGTQPLMLDMTQYVRVAAMLVVGGVGYYALVVAMRLGDVSAVVPFRYTRLVFAMLLGHFVFGERPDTLMLAGALLIVGTGLYTIWRTAIRRTSPA